VHFPHHDWSRDKVRERGLRSEDAAVAAVVADGAVADGRTSDSSPSSSATVLTTILAHVGGCMSRNFGSYLER